MSTQYAFVGLQCDGTKWNLISATPSFLNAALTGVPTTPTAAAGNNSTQVASTAYVDQNAVGGGGQSWQNLTGSRAASTSYTNSTGRPILVSITCGTSGGVSSLNVNSVDVANTGNNQTSTLQAIVPAGQSYYVTTATINNWAELR